MSKDITPKMPKNERDYRQQKANCNLWERKWRADHPKEHKKNSTELLSAISKNRTGFPIKKAKK